MKPRNLNILVAIVTSVQLTILAFAYLTYDQAKYEFSLSPQEVSTYQRLVVELQNCRPGDLVLGAKGDVYYVEGRSTFGPVVKKTALSPEEELVPYLAARREVVGFIRKDNPDYNFFTMRYVNQF